MPPLNDYMLPPRRGTTKQPAAWTPPEWWRFPDEQNSGRWDAYAELARVENVLIAMTAQDYLDAMHLYSSWLVQSRGLGGLVTAAYARMSKHRQGITTADVMLTTVEMRGLLEGVGLFYTLAESIHVTLPSPSASKAP